ncbi:TetR/AcrR family transcriptional regulator [Desertihabitans aurantiacus]|uniref:TetR/AcrR family transcriptional regulator n=1 Tax=Desertihabitans aurantiacus TaxID=2282477 RepID=UPI0018E4F2F6|nr:TetR/AcrR family transcriptional regulator [Desertihabitans aurantiacus]
MVGRSDPERIARKREQIAIEAGRLFGTQGYERTSVAQIAAAIGTSPASIFYYFTDKATLFRAVFERDLPATQALVARHADATDPLAAILAIVDELAQQADEPGASGLVVELLRRVEHDAELMGVVARTAQTVNEGLATLIARGIDHGAIDPTLDPTQSASWLQSIVDAIFLNAESGRSRRSELRRTVLGYLIPPSTTSPSSISLSTPD